MKRTALLTTILATLVVAPGAASGAGARAAVTAFDGPVVSVNRDARTFRLRDAERGTVTIKVNSRTRYERVNGFAGVRRGLVIEVRARRARSGWLALDVEVSGRNRGGRGRGRDDR